MSDSAKAAYTIWRGSHRNLGAPASWDDLGDVWRDAFSYVFMHGRAVEREECARIADGELMEVLAAGEERIVKSIAEQIRARSNDVQ